MISMLFSPIGRVATAIGALLVAVLSIYGKGRRDAAASLHAKQTDEANRRTKNALEADDNMRRDIARGGLLKNDGHRRD
jgi:hypothetical protein